MLSVSFLPVSAVCLALGVAFAVRSKDRMIRPARKRALASPCVTDRGSIVAKSASKAVTIYGIKSCDTMKKARAWLDAHDVAYAFHDYKVAGLERARLERWVKDIGWESLINRSGTTFRKLPERDRDGLTERRAIALMLEQPSMIKRPVLEAGGELIVGFKPEIYQKALR
jgi:arsenate reductase